MPRSPIQTQFGQRLRSLRLARHLTQGQLAESAGISCEYVGRMERGLASPSLTTLEKLAGALDVGVDALFRFSGVYGQAEESAAPGMHLRECLQAVFHDLRTGIFCSDESGRLLAANAHLARLLGAENSGDLLRRVRSIPDQLYLRPERRRRILEELPDTGEMMPWDVDLRRLDNELLPARLSIGRFTFNSQPILFGSVLPREQAERSAEPSGNSGDLTLLKEVHHRIKNNLNMLSSYFRLRAMDNDSLSAREVTSRIQAVADAHEAIYRHSQSRLAAPGPYLRKLLSSLEECVDFGFPVILDQECYKEELTSKHLCLIGMFVTEVLLNAAKHAFPDGVQDHNWVAVACAKENGGYRLSVEDNGVGLPEEALWEHDDSLGGSILHGLARQLRGTIHATHGSGTRVELRFPAPGN
ncbi:helix-turn-helix domain-containing protein [Desulfohalovibrio reitneri]|uniref:helix-turn-helix domain-containing protein n=1 Tax=Desulfohalovibrio reitneri TaxID=1307759 RepID=UPI001377CCB0|nr:helix-turn-helix domain-containing protein [Desulfohalovibrio reitneri]